MWQRRFPPRTGISGVYLCGAATHPGGSVAVIDTRTYTRSAQLDGGLGARPPVLSQDGTRLYVPSVVEGKVSVINTSTNTVIDTLRFPGGQPYAVAVNPSGTPVYVVDYLARQLRKVGPEAPTTAPPLTPAPANILP